MPPYRIALLFEYATLNGGERSMLAAIDWLQQNDPRFEFVAIAPTAGRLGEAFRERKIEVVDRPQKTRDGLASSTLDLEERLLHSIVDIKPNLLHANSLSMGRWTGRLATKLQIPTSSHLRDIIKLSRATITDLNHNSRLIAVSKATRDFHIVQGLREDCSTVVYNGLDLNHFCPRSPTGRLHAELGRLFPTSPARGEQQYCPLIATIGQIGLRKGQDILAEAAPFIVEKIPNAHFLIIGERSSQKLESIQFAESISSTFERANLRDRLHLLGHRDDVATLLNEIDLLIHPANQEPFGRVLLEASASGIPIVATDVGGTSEIIVNGETGVLIPPRDSLALATAVIDVLTTPSKAERLGAQAREHAVRHFSIANSANHLSSTWLELLERRRIEPTVQDGHLLRE